MGGDIGNKIKIFKEVENAYKNQGPNCGQVGRKICP
jgi:hypothetical protein